jgi:hypothetical protein
MKYIITESQLKSLMTEQPDSHFGPERFISGKDRFDTVHSSQSWDKANKEEHDLNNNTVYRNAIALMTSFLPFVPALASVALVGMDFKKDIEDAKTIEDKKRILLSYIIGMSSVWGLGKVFKSVASIGESGMTSLSNKMRRNVNVWRTLSSKEMAVIFDITNGQQFWADKLKNSVK